MDAHERVIWSMMARFERLALQLYTERVPALEVSQKRSLVGQLAPLAETELGTLDAPVSALLDSAKGRVAADVLLVQGLFLEPLGQLIYGVIGAHASSSERSRELAVEAEQASRSIAAQLQPLLKAEVGEGEPLFQAFVQATGGMLGKFDALGEAVDETFGERFGLRFATVLGQLSGELLPTCVALGMVRRKVLVHLTNGLMGDSL